VFDYKSKLVDSSRLLADILVEDIDNSEEKVNEMMSVALLDNYPVSMRTARILTLCAEKNSTLIHIHTMLQSLQIVKVTGVRRGFLQILSKLPECLDEDSLGILTDLAFQWMNNPKEAISIRYYSIQFGLYVVKKYPEIKAEFISILESMMMEDSAVLKAKCRNTIRLLNK